MWQQLIVAAVPPPPSCLHVCPANQQSKWPVCRAGRTAGGQPLKSSQCPLQPLVGQGKQSTCQSLLFAKIFIPILYVSKIVLLLIDSKQFSFVVGKIGATSSSNITISGGKQSSTASSQNSSNAIVSLNNSLQQCLEGSGGSPLSTCSTLFDIILIRLKTV